MRGYLVAFLVAQAFGDPTPIRVEWGPYDVQAADGTRVEVKATGRLQSWTLRKPSPPTWSFKGVRASSDEFGAVRGLDPRVSRGGDRGSTSCLR
jgi:hypothetical protein